ncbi:MAG: heparan-alpha-glucosaminide N-acetyltransferase domain-containing protein [Sphingobium sp.]
MASSISMASGAMQSDPKAQAAPVARTRLENIDALRGFVMVLMLLDHLRETWFVYLTVTDPFDARTMLPAIGFARFAVSFCAPIFVALTGLGVYLFSINHTVKETTSFLLKRGLLLMVIELVYLSPLYWGIVPQPTFWLQVIWCIGLCMIALTLLMRLPRPALIIFGLVLVCFHNLLDPIRLVQGDMLFPLWAGLHQRDAILLPFGFVAKTTYPILPWLGVISLGFGIGPWFAPNVAPETRQRRLLVLGFGMIAAFVILRLLNVYGDTPWYVVEGDPVRTVISFISMTKYPPSLLFLLPTLGGGALLLVLFERIRTSGLVAALAVFGAAPMFFYLFHLTVLRILYHSALAIWGPNHGTNFGFDNYNWVFVWYVAMIVPLYVPTVWFSRLKRRRRDIAWLKYF